MKQPKRLPTASPIDQAHAQAEAYESLFASTPLELDNGVTLMIPPHPDFGMLDDDRLEDYEDLLMAVQDYDREEEIYIPEQKLDNGVTLPAQTHKGALLRPYQKDGVRVKPAHSIKVVIAAIGEDEYARLRAGGKNAKDVWAIWGKQAIAAKERRAADPKSDASIVDLEPVSEADSE